MTPGRSVSVRWKDKRDDPNESLIRSFLMNMLIDVHHHAIPDFCAAAMRKEGMDEIDDFPIPEWSADKSLALMERAGIGFATLSVSAPGVSFLTRQMVRMVGQPFTLSIEKPKQSCVITL
jgi:hypothetical protein